MSFLIFTLALVLLIGSIFLVLFCLTPLFSRVPFVPVRSRAVKEMLDVFELKDENVLYDLGCGDGRVLFKAGNIYPNVEFVGIERAPFPYLLAKMRGMLYKNNNVSIRYGNFFTQDISKATHVFVYLFPSLLDELLPKFKRELKSGVKIFSVDFEFSGLIPENVVPLVSKKWQLNKKLNVYKM